MTIGLDDLSLERLMKERVWTFGKAGAEQVFASQISFESGGWLRGYSHTNENSWRVKGGAVEFLSQNAAVTTRFDTVRSVDGRIEMEGQFRLPGERGVHLLTECGEARKPQNRTALIVPIHDAYFIYGINLLFQSIGADYDIIFVFSTDADRLQFREMHQASPYLNYSSIVLSDYFSGSALSVVAEGRTWPTVKKFLALSLAHKLYDYLLCVDAETFILNKTGWTEAAASVVSAARWYGGTLTANHSAERQIMHASSIKLAPAVDHEKFRPFPAIGASIPGGGIFRSIRPRASRAFWSGLAGTPASNLWKGSSTAYSTISPTSSTWLFTVVSRSRWSKASPMRWNSATPGLSPRCINRSIQ